MKNNIILTRHTLRHIPDLRVDNNIFEGRFASSCSMAGCNAECCKGGVWADPKERDNIMTHAAMIQRHMDAGQEHRPDYWFELQEVKDSDFPSGSAIGTRASETGCVFLKADGKCVLQTTAVAEGMDRFALKPFYCVAYPVSIEYGELTIDDLEVLNRSECCCTVPNGEKTIFDVCNEELQFMLGDEGLKELLEARKEWAEGKTSGSG